MKFHIETQTPAGTGAASFNNVFSADYTNYLVFAKLIQTGSTIFGLRLRASGSDVTTSSYAVNIISQTAGSVSGLSTTATSVTFSDTDDAFSFGRVLIWQPFVNTTTQYHYDTQKNGNSAQRRGIGELTTSGSYDGFTIFSSGGNFGTDTRISVYGLKD